MCYINCQKEMSELIIAGTEKNGINLTKIRNKPLISWLHFLNLTTIAILCLLFLKLCKVILVLYKWFFPVIEVPKYPIILVLGPKNDTIQEIVHQFSQMFNSKVTVYQGLNFNISEVCEPQKNCRKSQIIYSQIPVNSQEMIFELKSYIQKAFGFVDILVISQNEDVREKGSNYDFLNNLNKQLLAQFWTVMAFLPGMLRKNSGFILSVALGRTSLVNTGIMRTIHEELLQSDTKVKLTLVESNSALDKCYLPPLSSDVLASFIVRSMWGSSSVVKVPSLPFYLIMLPILLLKFLLKPVMKLKNISSEQKIC